MPLLRKRDLAAVCLVVAALALAARWWWAPGWEGPTFRPRPDALEYAASAQALASGDGFYLQVGPYRVRPRYAPGWPMMLAPAAAAGVAGEHLWRVTGLFGALEAALLAALAGWAVAFTGRGSLGAPSGAKGRLAAAAAGLAAGAAWALGPMAIKTGRTLLSDEPAAFAATAALAGCGWGLLAPGSARRATLTCLAGGLATGLAAALRPAAGPLLLPPLALLALGGLRLWGWGATLRRSAAVAAGALVAPAATSAVLLASGLPAWPWTAYYLWIPGRYGDLADTFGLRFALAGNSDLASLPGLGGMPHLEIAARVLLGLPGLGSHQTLGLLWPIAGWAALLLLPVLARRGGVDARPAFWLAVAGAAWALAHAALYGLYFFPAARFFLPPLAVAAVALAVTGGRLLARGSAASRTAGAACLVLLAGSVAWGFLALRGEPHPDLPPSDTRAAFARWIDLPDAERAGRQLPFDPVEAQALGLLDRETAEGIHEWGELPPTVQVRRLRMAGEIPRPRR